MNRTLHRRATSQTLKIIFSLSTFFLGGLLLLCAFITPASAEVLDRIQINQAGDEAEIRIQFVTRIQFVRQVMLNNGDIRLYFNLLEKDADPKIVRQRRESPPSNIVPRFTVTYPEIDSSLTLSFGKPINNYHIRAGSDGRSISFFTPIIDKPTQDAKPVGKPIVTAPVPRAPISSAQRSAAEKELTELEAKQLMENANSALSNNLGQAQAALLRRLLSLPDNQQTQAAQLMLAQAYERNKEYPKARREYANYLSRYPKAKNADLAIEGIKRGFATGLDVEQSAPEKLPVSDQFITFGSLSQYYYKGQLQADNTDQPSGIVTPFSMTDQSQLLNSFEFTGMKRTADSETRLVFRDTYTKSFLSTVASNNFLDAAYLEQGTSDQSYFYGLGRQTGSSGGVPSRYDGAWLGHNFNTSWRINGSVGQPVQPAGTSQEAKTFASLSTNLTRQPGQWDGNAYMVAQRIAGILDRRAVGIETHFYDANNSHSGVLEYDSLFKKVGIALLQGNWTSIEGKQYTLLINHRRQNALQISNALLNQAPNTQTIANLIKTGTSRQSLLAEALLTNPIVNQLNVGMTVPYSPKLKIGGDFRISNTAAYTAYHLVKDINNPNNWIASTDPLPKTNAYTFSMQLIGNNLLLDNDLGIASASYTSASTYKSQSLSFSQVETFRKNWQLDAALLLSSVSNTQTGDTKNINPSLKLSYRKNDTLNFEIAVGLLRSNFTSPTLNQKSQRKYFDLGYRWDFR